MLIGGGLGDGIRSDGFGPPREVCSESEGFVRRRCVIELSVKYTLLHARTRSSVAGSFALLSSSYLLL